MTAYPKVVKVRVSRLDGDIHVSVFDEKTTVRVVKCFIDETVNIPCECQRLVAGSCEVTDDETFANIVGMDITTIPGVLLLSRILSRLRTRAALQQTNDMHAVYRPLPKPFVHASSGSACGPHVPAMCEYFYTRFRCVLVDFR